MARFTYRAKDSHLHLVEGMIEAESEAAAITRLGSQGVYPVSIAVAGAAEPTKRRLAGGRISAQDLAHATHQLADLLGGGLPLLGSLTLLARQTERRALSVVIDTLADSVRDGRALSDALSEFPKVFAPLSISMVRAGEVSGTLERALVRLAQLGEAEAELRSRVRSAMVYPLIVLCVALVMTVVLIGWVIPALSEVFADTGQLLPLPTRLLLAVSDLFLRWWWAVTAVLAGVGWTAAKWRRTAAGGAMLDRLVLSMPGFGELTRKLATAQFARALGVMVSQGVPILQAVDVVSTSVSNGVIRLALSRVHDAVREGSTIAGALDASGQFPVLVSNMVAVGEESGTVDTALEKIALTYEREADRAIRNLMTVLGPVLLVMVCGVVMFIVLAMLLPIFQMGLVVQ